MVNARRGLSIETITNEADLASLEPEWQALWLRSPDATPFQSPAWLIAWWKCFGENGLYTLALRAHGRLVGVAPCFVDEATRTLLLIGTGISDYLDILIEPGFENDVTSALFRHFQHQQDRWNACDFQELREDSSFLRGAAYWPGKITAQSVCPVLPLPRHIEELSQVVPAHTWRKYNYYRRRAEKLGELSFERAGENNFDELFDAFVHLHCRLWKVRDKPGALAQQALRDFHRAAARQLLSIGALWLHAIRLKGRIIACLYAFGPRRVYFYLSGFDPALSKLSPGTLIIGHAIEEAVRHGAVEFDFLRGDEPYKSSWGAKSRLSYRWRAQTDLVGQDPIVSEAGVRDFAPKEFAAASRLPEQL